MVHLHLAEFLKSVQLLKSSRHKVKAFLHETSSHTNTHTPLLEGLCNLLVEG